MGRTLFKATIKGVFLSRSSWIDSMVCGSSPCMISMTKMAILHSDDPRDRRFVNDSCPGVSMTSNPGTLNSIFPS